ncbi:MAG: hypothetical protein ABWX94_01610 [Candidatus Saccharimonadales bacterium]
MQPTSEINHDPVVPLREQITNLVSNDPITFEEQKGSFITERLQELEAQTTQPEAAVNSLTDHYSGFLTSENEISPSPNYRGFRMDDPKIYDLVLGEMRDILQRQDQAPAGEPKKPFYKVALAATQAAQERYFGGISPTSEQTALHDKVMQDNELKSIVDYKDSALCVQRSAVANNMLQFLGIPTTMKFGYLEVPGETPPMPHAFLLLKNTKGVTQLYDPISPTLIHDEQNRVIDTRPRHPNVPAEIEATNGVMSTYLKASVMIGGHEYKTDVPVLYHLESDKKHILSVMEALRQLALIKTVDLPPDSTTASSN